ncbi:MAG TPA: hypothetical protein VK608_02790 [Edaphobacter sp.]|nr:hypothetical protein [Edaphobacter sp.]
MQNDDDLDKVIREIVTLQLAHNQLVVANEQATARIDQLETQVALQTRLMESHQVEIEDLKLRLVTGGIVQ